VFDDVVVDFWSSGRSAAAVKMWRENPLLRQSAESRGSTTAFQERDVADILRDMDAADINVSVVSGLAGTNPLAPPENYSIHEVLGWCQTYPDRLRAALSFGASDSTSAVCRLIDDLASNPFLVVVRVISIFLNEPINSPRLYPVYEHCQALGVPVSINVGVPGPRTRTRFQHPLLLDDILIDFPDLTIIAAHMGHPWERLLIRFMRKYERLYLSNSAWSAKYLDPDVVKFMDSSTGRSRLIFASDAPVLTPQRAARDARDLPISPEAMKAFLGGNATRALGLLPDGSLERHRH